MVCTNRAICRCCCTITTDNTPTTRAAAPATAATTLTQRFLVFALVLNCTWRMVSAMMNIVLPLDWPPALARSSATFFAATSPRRAVWVSALALR